MPTSPLVPDISAGLRGFEFGKNIRRTRAADQRLEQDREIQLQSIQAGNIASESNAMLQFDSPELLRANLIRRAQEVSKNPVEGLNAEDFIDMANRLGDENGFSNIQAELKADLARAQEIGSAVKQQFGTSAQGVQQAVNVPGVGFKTLSRDGTVGLVQLPDADQAIIKLALKEKAERDASAAGLKAKTVAGVELETKPEIEGLVETAKGESQASTAAQIQEQKGLGAESARVSSVINKAASQARRTRPKVAAVRKALNGIDTGKLAQVMASLGSFIPGLNVDDEQVMQSQITRFVLDTLAEQGGTKTDFDFIKASEASASLGKTTEANKAILDILIKNLDRNIEEHKQFKSFRRGGGKALDFEFNDTESQPVRRIRFDNQGNVIQ